jgi:protein-disulfide isomerase
MENNIEKIKTRKWFTKWWGIVIIIFSLLVLLLIIYFSFLVYRFKRGIESGELIIGNVIGQYSEFEGQINNSITINRQEIEALGNPSMGSNDPIMTIVEFSDFNCPYCAIIHPIIKEFVLEYPEKVKVIFRDFPLSGNQAAMAANCAFEQGRFWEMHDKLFANQKNLSETIIKQIADEMRLEMDSFNNCYDNQKYEQNIQKDLAVGIKAGVEGTPTLFINGQRFPGVMPEDVLKQILYAIEQGE